LIFEAIFNIKNNKDVCCKAPGLFVATCYLKKIEMVELIVDLWQPLSEKETNMVIVSLSPCIFVATCNFYYNLLSNMFMKKLLFSL
jgi:hypothetical protein